MNKKQIIITSAAVIVSFAIGFFVGDSSAINRVNKAIDTTSTTSNGTTTPNKNTAVKSDKTNYKFGEEGKSGSWNIKVLDAQEATTIQAGNSSDNKTTQQKFIVLKLQMTDIDNTPHQYSGNDFMLGNAKDKKQYQVAIEAMQAANGKETIYNQNSNFFGVYDDINPSTPKQTYIIFEVPKDFNVSDGVLVHGTSDADMAGYNIK